jgi:hypothetical protein
MQCTVCSKDFVQVDQVRLTPKVRFVMYYAWEHNSHGAHWCCQGCAQTWEAWQMLNGAKRVQGKQSVNYVEVLE